MRTLAEAAELSRERVRSAVARAADELVARQMREEVITRNESLRIELAFAIAEERAASERVSALIRELCQTCDTGTRSAIITQAFNLAHREE